MHYSIILLKTVSRLTVKYHTFLILLIIMLAFSLFSSCSKKKYPSWFGCKSYIYSQTVEGEPIDLRVSFPKGKGTHPAVLLFHGGNWQNGTNREFSGYIRFLSSMGITGISASYRTMKKYNTEVPDLINDAEKAYQWVVAHAEELHIDPDRIIIGGGSAGGHLAFWVAKRTVGKAYPPLGLMMIHAALDTASLKDSDEIFGMRAHELSPVENIVPNLPATLIIHAENDEIISRKILDDFLLQMKSRGNRIDSFIEPGALHGSYVWLAGEPRPATVDLMMSWLHKIL